VFTALVEWVNSASNGFRGTEKRRAGVGFRFGRK
jgi:hypothetical protein